MHNKNVPEQNEQSLLGDKRSLNLANQKNKYEIKWNEMKQKTFHLPSGVLSSCKALPNRMLGLGPGSFLTGAKA